MNFRADFHWISDEDDRIENSKEEEWSRDRFDEVDVELPYLAKLGCILPEQDPKRIPTTMETRMNAV